MELHVTSSRKNSRVFRFHVFYPSRSTHQPSTTTHLLPPTVVRTITSTMIGDAAAVGIGAAAGALCRHQIGNIASRKIAEDPTRFGSFTGWHTCGINVCGSLLLGFVAGLPNTTEVQSANNAGLVEGLSSRTRLMAGVGFCGSFTTFSTYSVDAVGMLSNGQMTRALSYVAANNIGSITAAYSGFNLAKRLVMR